MPLTAHWLRFVDVPGLRGASSSVIVSGDEDHEQWIIRPLAGTRSPA
jgi:hypothetical protein